MTVRSPDHARVAGTALVPFVPPPRTVNSGRSRSRVILWGMGVAFVLGLGAAGVWAVENGGAPARLHADASAPAPARVQDEVTRLRLSLDELRRELDQVKATNAVTLARLSSNLEKADRETVPRVAEFATRLDRLDREVSGKASDVAQKQGALQSRLERIEQQMSASSVVTGSVPTAGKTGASGADTTVVARSVATPAPARPQVAGAWVLRDVYDGVAVVESRRGGLREVAPGEYLPGMGEVRSIERRGRSWVVLTSRGVIDRDVW